MTQNIISRFEKLFFILIVLAISFSILLLLAHIDIPEPKEKIDTLLYNESIQLGEGQLFIARADTDAERLKGLSNQEYLFENQGLFFVFPELGNYAIWMKDMKFAIDVVWFDENFSIVHIEKSLTPESYPKTFSSPLPSRYILEIRAGAAEKLQLEVGDRIQFL
jgi:uncharacterized membrane protein (UPF0127 family)